jgi:acetyltransferase
MVKFHETLSERSVYFRYFHAMQLTQRIAHDRLTRICFIDYDREIARRAANSANRESKSRRGPFAKIRSGKGFAIISDNWHHRGRSRTEASRG